MNRDTAGDSYDPLDGQNEGIRMLSEMTRGILERRRWSFRDAETMTGIKTSNIYNLARGKSVLPDTAARFAEAMGEDADLWRALAAGIPAERLLPPGLNNLPKAAQRQVLGAIQSYVVGGSASIPVLGRIGAGDGVFAETNIERYVEVGAKLGDCFAVQVRGDSMEGLHIVAGDLVIFRQGCNADDGDIVAAVKGDEAIIKVLRKKPNASPYLESVYADGRRERIDLSDSDQIIGVYQGLKRE